MYLSRIKILNSGGWLASAFCSCLTEVEPTSALWFCAFLLTTITQSDCTFSVSSVDLLHHQSISIHRTAGHWVSFSSNHFRVNFKYCFIKVPKDEQVEILKPAHLSPTIIPQSKVTDFPFTPYSDRWWEHYCWLIAGLCMNVFNALHWCHIIGWLDHCINE